MLSGCLNSLCGAPYHYHREGRIFRIDRIISGTSGSEPQRQVEHYWLCAACSAKLKVIVEDGHVITVPIEPEPMDEPTGNPALQPYFPRI
jgi:hypothetical protein